VRDEKRLAHAHPFGPCSQADIAISVEINNPSSFDIMDLGKVFINVHTELKKNVSSCTQTAAYVPLNGVASPCDERETLGPHFVQVTTPPDFAILQGQNPKVLVHGHLDAPNRERESLGASVVFDTFVANKSSPLIALILNSSQPFYTEASSGILVRCTLPGISYPKMMRRTFSQLTMGATGRGVTPFQTRTLNKYPPPPPPIDLISKIARGAFDLGGYENALAEDVGAVVEVVHIDFNIPIAISTMMTGPIFGGSGCLQQYVRLEMKNPVGSELLIEGLIVDVYYDGTRIAAVDLPSLGAERTIKMSGFEYLEAERMEWLPVIIDCNSPAVVSAVIKLLYAMQAFDFYQRGIGGHADPALAHVEATILIEIGGIKPFIKYSQNEVPVIL